MILTALIASGAVHAQTAGNPYSQPPTGQTSGQTQENNSQSSGQVPVITPPQVRPDPTQITFGPPDQDAKDQGKDSQNGQPD